MAGESEIVVTFPGGKRVDAQVGGHVVRTDQPVQGGGEDSAPTPFALFAASTPSQVNKSLGVELDLGVKYQSDDGFVFFLDYGLLKLLSGFDMTTGTGASAATTNPSGVAQNIHAGLGIVF